MSRLDELIAELCPNGVEYKKLGEIGIFFGGLTGKNKNDFMHGNARYITYMNIFSSPSVNFKDIQNVKISPDEKQNKVLLGDILFTGSSENLEECGISSVVTEYHDNIFLNSFCFGFRLKSENILIPHFSKHLFRDIKVRNQIIKTANGVTRFNVSKKKMENVKIPVPPLPVQEEIVRILDTFSELTAELIAELSKRKQQYQYYRENLLCFEDKNIWKSLRDVCINISSGGTPLKSKSNYYNGNIPWLRTQEVKFCNILETEMMISQEGLENSSAKWIPENCVIVAISGATAARCAINKVPLTTNQHCCNLEINPHIALYRYVFHWLSSQYDKLKSLGQGAREDLNIGIICAYPIPVPPLEEQERIVAILDRFDALCNDLTSGLPAEIEARKKQYEYYRDKLLTFKEAV